MIRPHLRPPFRFLSGAVALTLVAALLPAQATRSQPAQIGVTWSVPDDFEQAASDLLRMRESGIRIVRTGPVGSDTLYSLADSLRIRFFQDLPVSHLPAPRLADTLQFAGEHLDSLIEYARRYASGRNIGLARLPDTSDPAACSYFEALASRIDGSGADVWTYYTTVFGVSDRCNSYVDGVLIHALNVDSTKMRPLLIAGRQSIPNLAGLASTGAWTDLELGNRGVRSHRSPEWQARFLEEALGFAADADVRYVFVHRWRDPAGIDDEFSDLVQRRYGVHNSAYGPRPVFDVLRGFATGRQSVFAFEDRGSSTRRWMWMTILGWLAIGGLAVLYVTSPQMRHMVPRYFRSHGFYREAVGSGRESLAAETIGLLTAVSLGVGMQLATIATEISTLRVFDVAKAWLAPSVRDFAGAVLDQPWTLTVILGSLFAITLVSWTSTLSLVSRRRLTLLPAQALVLVVWSHWPLLLFLLVSPAIASASESPRITAAILATAALCILVLVAIARTLLDFRSTSRVGAGWLSIAVLSQPLMLITLVALYLATLNSPEARYIWHLLTRL